MMQKTILFVAYGGGHAHMVYPVVHALRKSKKIENQKLNICVLGLTSAQEIFRNNGVKSFGFANFLDKENDTDAIAWGVELAKKHHSPAAVPDINDSIAYLGLNYKDLVTRLGADEAARLFEEKERHAFFPLTIMERIFDDIQPDFVVTTNSPKSEAAAITTANERGIESLIITDLFSGFGGYVLQAKNITFLTRVAKDMLVDDGLVDEKLSNFHYTGNPAFDKILQLAKDEDPEWIRENFKEKHIKPAVLHADMPAYWDPEKKCAHFKSDAETLEELDATYKAARYNDAIYLVRPHPSQGHELYKEWLKNKDHAHLAADFDLHVLLKNVSLLLVRTSTVGIEAAYMQKRILQLDSDFHKDLPLAKMGIAWGSNSYSDLPEVMSNVLIDKRKYEEIKQQIKKTLPEEPAAQKIAEIILEKL